MMNRGDIFRADLNPTKGSEQAGYRPVIIVSRDGINCSSPVVVIVPLTKLQAKKKIYPSHHIVQANRDNGLDVDSIAKCEQIRAIAKSRLSRKLGNLGTEDLLKIDAALKIVLNLK